MLKLHTHMYGRSELSLWLSQQFANEFATIDVHPVLCRDKQVCVLALPMSMLDWKNNPAEAVLMRPV